MLEAGKLVDMYRRLHPAPDEGDQVDRDAPIYTWRGVGEDAYAYGGKGMRIDHCLVSEAFVNQISDVTICGRGQGSQARGEGFYGSDHCPMFIKLVSDTADTADAKLTPAASGTGGSVE